MSNTYNGWTNYATWRVNLEIFDGTNPKDLTGRVDWTGSTECTANDLSEYLKDWAEEIIYNDTPDGGLARDYALAFLDGVNWFEIAKQMIEDYADEEAEA